LELRAALSLVRVQRLRGRESGYCAKLRELCGSFGEGQDTLDVREARLVLDG
jgi:hypothetical protein